MNFSRFGLSARKRPCDEDGPNVGMARTSVWRNEESAAPLKVCLPFSGHVVFLAAHSSVMCFCFALSVVLRVFVDILCGPACPL